MRNINKIIIKTMKKEENPGNMMIYNVFLWVKFMN